MSFDAFLAFVLAIVAIWMARRANRNALTAMAALQAEIAEHRRERSSPAPHVAPRPVPQEQPRPAPQGVVERVPPPVSRLPQAEPSPAPTPAGHHPRRFPDIEQLLGTNWLSKLGVAVLVLGVAFFLAWQLRQVGPAGKVTIGFVTSAVLLLSGVLAERSERYRLLARAALAGGWALLFFVAYAAHHIPAARVVASPSLGLTLMLIVAAAMAAHTLQYDSQALTALAFTLAFATIAVNHVELYSLTANAILALAVCTIAVRRRWQHLELFGMGVAYLMHYIWLIPIIAPMGQHRHDFPEFASSVAILAIYWAIFRVPYVLRSNCDEALAAFTAILNSALLLAVLKYQTANQQIAFFGLLSLGCAELLLSFISRARGHRPPFVLLATLGAACIVAAIPFRYAPDHVSPIWLIESLIFFAAGVVIKERVFRRIGTLAAACTALQIASIHGARILGERLYSVDLHREWVLGAIAIAAMATLYAVAVWAPRRWPSLFDHHIDRRLALHASYIAPLLGVIGAWFICPGPGAALAWMSLAAALAWLSHRFAIPEVTVQADLLFIATCLRTLATNLPSNAIAFGPPLEITYRVATVSLIVLVAYAFARWSSTERFAFTTYVPPAVTWAASALGALLIWYELLPASVAVAWALFAVILFEAGQRLRSTNLRFQAYAALVAAFSRLFIVNLNIEAGSIFSVRVYTVIAVAAALFYVHDRLHAAAGNFERQRPEFAMLFAWLSATAIASLLRFECSADLVVVAWAAMAFALMGVAVLLERRVFADIAIALSVATLARGVLHNLYERSYFPWPNTVAPWVIIGAAVALLMAALPLAFRLRQLDVLLDGSPISRALRFVSARPEQIFFFAALILTTALLASETRHGMLTVAWGLEALITFVFALWVKERSYRLAALSLLLLCASKILLFDFWSLGIRDKAVTGIVLGLSLIAVSVLYTRNRDALHQLL